MKNLKNAYSLENMGRRSKLLLEAVGEGIYGMDMAGNVIFANKAAETIVGYTAEEMLGRHSHELFHYAKAGGATYKAHDCNIYATSKDGKVRRVSDEVFWRKDGSPVPVEYTATPVKESGIITGVVVAFKDITDRLKMEGERHRLASIMEQSSELVMVTDTDGRIQHVNRAFEEFTGISRRDALGKPASILKSGANPDSHYAEIWTALKKGKTWRGRLTNRKGDGSQREMDVIIFPLSDQSGAIASYVALERDITNEAALETQLRHMQKMEAVGLLAGGIAHDFNNVIGAILGYTELLLKAVKKDPALTADLSEIKKAAESAAGLTRQLLAFARKQPSIKRPFNLNDTLRGLRKMLSRLLGKTVKFELELETGLKNINADPLQFEQVIMNLAVNARDAMPGGGKITLITKNISIDDRSPGILAKLPPGKYSLLSFRDTGIGMDKNTLSRIFEPFFTTKGPGKGTGLGLSIVYNIVRQNGGCVLVDSAPGRGTEFNIYLPATDAALTQLKTEEAGEGVARGAGTVLLVDDNSAMRRYMARVLSEEGYTVVDFADAESALAAAKNAPEAPDLLITDLVLPGKGGFELARELSTLKPGLKTVFISGYDEADKLEGNAAGANARFLQKPFDMLSLLEALRGRTET